MDNVVSAIRKRCANRTPRINYIAAIDERCVRIEYSTSSKVRWLEVWTTSPASQNYVVLRPEKPRDTMVVTMAEMLTFLDTKFIPIEDDNK